jgi:hypothetical protein
MTATIVQNTLKWRLPHALAGITNKEQLIEEIRHSVIALRHLPPDIQYKARLVYYQGIRYSFAASTAIAAVAILASLFARKGGLRSTN